MSETLVIPSQPGLLAAADAVSATNWQARPDRDSWSAAHLVGHLRQVERSVLGHADRVIRKTPFPVPYLQRFHVPFLVVDKAADPPQIAYPYCCGVVLRTKRPCWQKLRGVRGPTLSFPGKTRDRDLSVYYWPHPFPGERNFYNWFTFIAVHQIRHTKQMVEIAKNLPKRVVPS